MQGPSRNAKRVVAKGYEESLETLPPKLRLPTLLGLWEDDNADGCWSSPGHEIGAYALEKRQTM
jgi:hypothetical protein